MTRPPSYLSTHQRMDIWVASIFFFFFGYYKQCCREHSCTNFCVDMFPFLSVIYLEVELLSPMIAIFSFLKNFGTFFHRGCTSCTVLHSYQQSMKVLISPHHHQHLLFVYRHPRGCEVPHFVILMWSISFWFVFPYVNDTEHLFMWILTICLFLKNVQILCSFFDLSFCCWVVGFFFNI